jgi:hypothetical protein
MRDYAIQRATASESLGSSLIGLVHNWQARRRIARWLSDGETPDHGLGLSAVDLRWAMRLPLDQNPLVALEDLAFRRSRA